MFRSKNGSSRADDLYDEIVSNISQL